MKIGKNVSLREDLGTFQWPPARALRQVNLSAGPLRATSGTTVARGARGVGLVGLLVTAPAGLCVLDVSGRGSSLRRRSSKFGVPDVGLQPFRPQAEA